MPRSNFYFNPTENGLLVFLGSTESKLMEIAWEHKEITVKTALFYYPDNKKPAYTTIMTILSRLADKLVLNKQKVGRSFTYTPSSTRELFIKQRIEKINNCLAKF